MIALCCTYAGVDCAVVGVLVLVATFLAGAGLTLICAGLWAALSNSDSTDGRNVVE